MAVNRKILFAGECAVWERNIIFDDHLKWDMEKLLKSKLKEIYIFDIFEGSERNNICYLFLTALKFPFQYS